MSHIDGIAGKVWFKDEEGYETARRSAVWQAIKPDRYPEVIVRVASEQDVVQAVRYAKEHGLKVSARSGGHSFTGAALRTGLLIDFSELKEISIDAEAYSATITPGVKGGDLTPLLAERGLFFPGGHDRDVGLGGFLLQGGFGWNSRELGPACASVRAVDVVTADGELIHSDDDTNPDFVWAARGAGPGFFGIVTRYYLNLYPLPSALHSSLHVYPIDTYDELVPWFLRTAEASPRWVEPFLVSAIPPDAPEGSGPVLVAFAIAHADSTEDALAALAPFDSSPLADRAIARQGATAKTLLECYDFFIEAGAGADGRYCYDGMWTDAPVDEVVPPLREMFVDLPTRKSAAMFMPWSSTEVNGVFSLQAPLYVSPMAVWDEPADDALCIAWAVDHMKRLEPLSLGIQLADENLINRSAPFLAPDRLARLEELREKHDPTRMFHSYLLSDADS